MVAVVLGASLPEEHTLGVVFRHDKGVATSVALGACHVADRVGHLPDLSVLVVVDRGRRVVSEKCMERARDDLSAKIVSPPHDP